jgi:hypothetical protein
MYVSNGKCKHCKEKLPDHMVRSGLSYFCDLDCAKADMKKKAKKKKGKTVLQKKKDNSNSLYWRNKADKEWGKLIHLLYYGCAVDNGECKGKLEAHHLISRSRIITRHDPNNGILLCSHHHRFSKFISPHGAPMAFSEWLMASDPDRWAWLSANKYATGKYNHKESYERLIKLVEYAEKDRLPF